MNDFDKLNVLDANGFYVTDFIVGMSGDTLPDNWTADLVGDGYYKAQYQGGTRDAATGQWTNGHWVETGGPSHENLVAAARNKRDGLMAEASEVIAPLQDAVDLEIATDQEVALLKAWKTYRVLLNRIDPETAPNIVWPTPPARLNRSVADAS